MPGKEAILEQIRGNKPAKTNLPESKPSQSKKTNEELLEEFKTNLLLAGADVVKLSSKDEVQQYISKHYKGSIDFKTLENWQNYGPGTSKNKLEKIGTVILNGNFAVAENGAVWLDESCFLNRLIPFIAEQLIIEVEKNNIVNDMQDAYKFIDLSKVGFGVFISGPSKTADIEQSLVYGAHGAKKTVILLY